jgi:hypothetical protein
MDVFTKVRGKCRYWPVTMLNADHIDSISAARIILAEILNNNKIVAVDQLDDEFLEYGRHPGTGTSSHQTFTISRMDITLWSQ